VIKIVCLELQVVGYFGAFATIVNLLLAPCNLMETSSCLINLKIRNIYFI